MKCLYSLCNNELKGKQEKYCSRNCKNKYHIIDLRRKRKEKAINYKGGKCLACGYNKCFSALDFHHIDSSKKDFGISSSGKIRTWESIKKELNKCVLLCANCHREAHMGLIDIKSL